MKANEVPEKLYILFNHPHNVDYTKLNKRRYEEEVEYTRTDAFIEKACEFFSKHLWEYIDVKNANCDTFINIDGDKLEEDFVNYMKRE